MSTNTNPYKPPQSNTTEKSMAGSGTIPLYSPIQANMGAFFGGPLAAAQMIRQNFLAMGEKDLAQKSTVIGILIFLMALAPLPFLPEKFPNMAIPMIYIVITSFFMKKYQLTKEQISASDKYTFHSNWKVAGVSVVWLLATTPIAILWVWIVIG